MESYESFATKRIVLGIALALAAVWIFAAVIGLFEPPHKAVQAPNVSARTLHGAADLLDAQDSGHSSHPVAAPAHGEPAAAAAAHAEGGHGAPDAAGHGTATAQPTSPKSAALPAAGSAMHPPTTHGPAKSESADEGAHAQPALPAAGGHGAVATGVHGAGAAGGHGASSLPPGVAFVDGVIKPLDHELNERFWGWRCNDILNFTDNVDNFQLGVLEVTRRTAVALAERISRTGSTAAFDINLEQAMNWLMIKAESYWFPTPESKYEDALDEFRAYREKLVRGEARFFTRTDNLIPLLMAYEDLLGSCEENLVKHREDDGSTVSFFMADDYFYYAQGVASAMGTILEGIAGDFQATVESRRGAEVLHHAIESCHHAKEIHPWIITNADLSGILANHRANLAAPMSHARFYINVLIKALST
jgi:hypothetical protein